MSNFLVSARKYRPVNFDTVVGQPAISNTLKSAIRSGQVAHAYLFCGPRGVGKTTCARIFAKTLNCFNLSETIEACEQCESCRSFNESRSFNIHELDAASNNSVDDIRSLTDKVRIIPQVGKYSIYIIDEVHMLSQAAFNAFLKTLEEPPAHAIFILATTEKHKIIPTILSRCQIFDFHRIRVEDIVGYLSHVARLENIHYEEEALNIIALKADGAMRDALSIFDQVASFSQKNITYAEVLENLNVLDYEYYFKIIEAFLSGNSSKALVIFDEILQRGFDGQNFIGGLSTHFRDLLVCRDAATLKLLEVSDVLKSRYQKQAVACEPDFLFQALEICSQCELSYRASRNQRLHVELSLIRLCNIAGEKKKLNPEKESLVIPDMVSLPENKASGKQAPPMTVTATQVVTPPTAMPVPTVPPPPVVKNPAVSGEPEPPYIVPLRISIKDALRATSPEIVEQEDIEGVTEDIPAEITSTGSKPLSEEFLSICWNAYSGQIREDKPRMAVTIRNIHPVISENTVIRIEMKNRDQMEDFNSSIKNDLEKFLRREMQNDLITIEAQLIETIDDGQVRLYTSEEKFKYLNQKNPLLSKFRQELNLELE
jgi:DNA polymerase III subunit gamma/tau